MKTTAFFFVLCVCHSGVVASSADTFRFVPGPGHLDLLHGNRPVYRHVTAFDSTRLSETFKVFHHLYGFHGEGFLTKGSEGTYPHQRGLSLAWLTATAEGKTTGTWQGLGAEGWQRHIRYLPERDLVSAERARKASLTHWLDPKGALVARDIREVTAQFDGQGRLVLDFSIRIESAGGTLVLAGDPHHGGFHFRGLDAPTPMRFLLPADADSLQDDAFALESDAAWGLSLFAVKDNPYAVLLMDHPRNPRPVQLGKRAYGRMGFFFPARIPADKPLELMYRVMIQERSLSPAPTRDQIASLYAGFTTGSPVRAYPRASRKPKRKSFIGLPPDIQATGRRLPQP